MTITKEEGFDLIHDYIPDAERDRMLDRQIDGDYQILSNFVKDLERLLELNQGQEATDLGGRLLESFAVIHKRLTGLRLQNPMESLALESLVILERVIQELYERARKEIQ